MISALFGFVTTVLLLGAWLHLGAARTLVAVPNERSSHSEPTPTGGGVAIVIIVLAVLFAYFLFGATSAGVLGLSLLIIAALGLADDLWELSAKTRLVVQLVTVGALLWGCESILRLQATELAGMPQWLLLVVLTLAIVWFLNLFNFMDGIDGLAAGQCAAFCLCALFFMHGDAGWIGGFLWVLLATSLAFLVFNAAPARIFMGDAGSAFLGLALGWLALELALLNLLPLLSSLVLLSAFWFDASYTLVVRWATSQRVTEAHRSHLYQRLADRMGHARTTLAYAVLWLCWDAPLVYWCRLEQTAMAQGAIQSSTLNPQWLVSALWVLPVACLPLLIGCVLLRAGQPPIIRNN